MVAVLKGLARATRGARLVRRTSLVLSREAEEALLDIADVMSEGGLGESGGEERYFGSTMVTFELDQLARAWRGPIDDRVADDIVRAISGSVRMRVRILRLAHGEALRRMGAEQGAQGTATYETRVRRDGRCIHVDVDLEVPLGVSSRLRRR